MVDVGFKQTVGSNWNISISTIAKSGNVAAAKKVFDDMPCKNIVSWNAILAAFTQNGQYEDAKHLFDRMPGWNLISHNIMLDSFARQRNLTSLDEIFRSMQETSLVSWTIVLSAHAQAGDSDRASSILFRDMPVTNLFSWNALLGAVTRSGNCRSAAELLERFPEYDVVSGNTILKESASFCHGFSPKSIFDWMEWHDIISWTLLLSFYLREKESLAMAERIYEESMPEHDITSTTMLLAAYNTNLELAGKLFQNMPFHDVVSSNVMLLAYGHGTKVDDAEMLFFREMCQRDSSSWNAMLGIYAKCGHIQHCKTLINVMLDITPTSLCVFIKNSTKYLDKDLLESILARLPYHDMLSGTSLMVAYANTGEYLKGEEVFRTMLNRNLVAFNAMLAVLVQWRGLERAREFFDYRMPEHDLVSRTTLAAAYTENNYHHEALTLLDLGVRDAFSESVVLNSLSRAGFSRKELNSIEQDSLKANCLSNVLATFWKMCLEGVVSNKIIEIGVLNACSHLGDVSTARRCFQSISADYSTVWTKQGFGCMIDLLARAGNFDEAEELMNSMPYMPEFEDWTCLASQVQVNEQ